MRDVSQGQGEIRYRLVFRVKKPRSRHQLNHSGIASSIIMSDMVSR